MLLVWIAFVIIHVLMLCTEGFSELQAVGGDGYVCGVFNVATTLDGHINVELRLSDPGGYLASLFFSPGTSLSKAQSDAIFGTVFERHMWSRQTELRQQCGPQIFPLEADGGVIAIDLCNGFGGSSGVAVQEMLSDENMNMYEMWTIDVAGGNAFVGSEHCNEATHSIKISRISSAELLVSHHSFSLLYKSKVCTTGPAYKSSATTHPTDLQARHPKQIVELVVVNDVRMYKDKGMFTEAYTRDIVNRTNTIFANNNLNPPIELRLVHQLTIRESKDPWGSDAYTEPSSLLTDFSEYWEGLDSTDFPSYDLVFLFSYSEFLNYTVGLARTCQLCSGRHGSAFHGEGLVRANMGMQQTALTLAHEIGHSIGMGHDGRTDEGNTCAALGFIMGAGFNGASGKFSSCSLLQWKASYEDLRSRTVELFNTTDICTSSSDSRLPNATCGNGFVEDGEECDCLGNDCSEDPCCNEDTCVLKSNAECSATMPCCEACSFASNRSVCRSSKGVCDVSEMCDGITAECPPDYLVGTGTHCNVSNSSGSCFAGQCVSYERQCIAVGSNGCPPDVYETLYSDGYNKMCGEFTCCTAAGKAVVMPSSGVPLDGTPCGNDGTSICVQEQCVESDGIVSFEEAVRGFSFMWGTSEFSACECPSSRYRTVSCIDMTVGRIVDDVYCSASSKPSDVETCVISFSCSSNRDGELENSWFWGMLVLVGFAAVVFVIVYACRRNIEPCSKACREKTCCRKCEDWCLQRDRARDAEWERRQRETGGIPPVGGFRLTYEMNGVGVQQGIESWACSRCTFHNPQGSQYCRMCKLAHSESSAAIDADDVVLHGL